MSREMQRTNQEPEIVGLRALAWLVGNEELLPTFLAASGVSADELRERAADPVFLGSVLDFILNEDAWVMGFCESVGLPYEAPAQARAMLPGGGQVHWT